jgi:hypothetical protein
VEAGHACGLSRAAAPKLLHRLSPDGSTLLRATLDRLSLLASPYHVLVITGSSHAAAVARICLELPADNIIIERQLVDPAGVHFVPLTVRLLPQLPNPRRLRSAWESTESYARSV